MNQRFKYIKSLVYNSHQAITLGYKNNHELYTIDLKGILQLPFYIIGVNYEVMIYDKAVSFEKVFNYNDPLIYSQMQIVAESTGDIFGDNINLTLIPGDWLKYSMSFQPGRVYDLSLSPIVIPKAKLNIIFDIYIDPAHILIGSELECIPSFKLFIGTN